VHALGHRIELLTICPCPKALDKKSGHGLGQARDVSVFLRVFWQKSVGPIFRYQIAMFAPSIIPSCAKRILG
jgi:hypothetical protein